MQIDQSLISKLIISSSPEGILIINKLGEIVLVNDALLKMFGYENEHELVGQRLEILIPDKYKESHVSHRTNFNKKPSNRKMGSDRVLYGKRKDGTQFAAEVGLNHIQVNNQSLTSALVTDVSDRVEFQEKLTKLNSELEDKVIERTNELENAILELQDANSTLEQQFSRIQKAEIEARQSLEKEKELNELKSRFVSMASHEFRTPLSTVLSSNSLIEKYLDKTDIDLSTKEKIDKHLARVKKSVKHLNEILEDLLSLGKLEEGKITCNKSSFNFYELVSEIKEEMSSYFKEGQYLTVEGESNITVYTDKNLLHNILLNLVSNASKYSIEGKEIILRTTLESDLIKIEVQDFGIGIPEADVSHMFERFFRAKNVTNIEGTGLGLNIVKKYVELLDGNINFTSEVDEGTTFTLTFNIGENG